jgi:hypothetical protein
MGEARHVSPDGFSIFLDIVTLPADESLEWTSAHGDDAVYVIDGSLQVDGQACPRGGAVIVESGVPAIVTATEPATLAHFGPV